MLQSAIPSDKLIRMRTIPILWSLRNEFFKIQWRKHYLIIFNAFTGRQIFSFRTNWKFSQKWYVEYERNECPGRHQYSASMNRGWYLALQRWGLRMIYQGHPCGGVSRRVKFWETEWDRKPVLHDIMWFRSERRWTKEKKRFGKRPLVV